MTVRLDEMQGALQEGPGRLERKFYVPSSQVAFALSFIRHLLAPHSRYPCEQINSLYFDTSALDLYGQSADGQRAKDKVRIRWYESDREGGEDSRAAFVELKSRRGMLSMKRRVELVVPVAALATRGVRNGIVSPSLLLRALAGFWYQPPGRLFPIITVAYQRYRFVEPLDGLSVALDCRIRSTAHLEGMGNLGTCVELPGAIIEVKGPSLALPPGLRRIGVLNVDWTRFSKYVACVDSHLEDSSVVGHGSPSGRLIGL